MKSPLLAFATAVAGILLAGSPAVAVQRHGHGAAAGTTSVPAMPWAPDASLREGMARVRAALADLDTHAPDAVPRDVALRLVDEIEDATRTMFARCRLPPDADAALHGMLVPLLAASGALRKDPADRGAVAAMHKAIANYPRWFADPAWPAPDHAHEAGRDSGAIP